MKIWTTIAGEMSKLRNKFSSLTRGGKYSQSYTLDTSKVDYKLTRGLYHNTVGKYKLGAGFAKPIIDTTTGFVGTPNWISEDETAQEVLTEHQEKFVSQLQKASRNTFRDGDCYLRVYREEIKNKALYKSERPRIKLKILPPQGVDPLIDPETGDVDGYEIRTNVTYEDDNREKSYDIIEQIREDSIIKWYEGNDVPRELKNITSERPQEETNKWGFVPIIHWKNESEEDELFGRSDLESAEPFLKAYHDVMMHSLQNNKMHSSPKLKLKLNDVSQFMKLNFGIDVENLRPGEKPTINLDGQEVIVQPHNDDEVELLQADDTMASSSVLLKFLFFCIVDVTQTPEFAFGTAVQSSMASVKEQMTPLVKKVERKREQLEENYKLLARMILAMYEKAQIGEEQFTFTTYNTTLGWEDINPKDIQTEAQTFLSYMTALTTGVEKRLISVETAVDFLQEYIPNMSMFKGEGSEEEKILSGIEFLERVGQNNMAMDLEELKTLQEEMNNLSNLEEGGTSGEE